jgi:hypothetical protein
MVKRFKLLLYKRVAKYHYKRAARYIEKGFITAYNLHLDKGDYYMTAWRSNRRKPL